MDISQYKQLVKAKGLNMIFLGDADDTKAFEVFFQKIKIGTVFFDKITLLFRVQFKEIKELNIEQMAMAALFDSIPIRRDLAIMDEMFILAREYKQMCIDAGRVKNGLVFMHDTATCETIIMTANNGGQIINALIKEDEIRMQNDGSQCV